MRFFDAMSFRTPSNFALAPSRQKFSRIFFAARCGLGSSDGSISLAVLFASLAAAIRRPTSSIDACRPLAPSPPSIFFSYASPRLSNGVNTPNRINRSRSVSINCRRCCKRVVRCAW